jgi:hypothetical protein
VPHLKKARAPQEQSMLIRMLQKSLLLPIAAPGPTLLSALTAISRGTNPPLSHHHLECATDGERQKMRVPERVRGDLYLGLAVTSLYTMGLIIAFT